MEEINQMKEPIFLIVFLLSEKSLFQRSEAIKQIGIYRNRHKCAKKKIFYAYFL